MLKKSCTELIHPCLGKIRFDSKFSKILELKPFRDLSQKRQLGAKFLSPKCANASHTRFLHSIGVYHLTSLLLNICKDKFSHYVDIFPEDEEVLKLAALGHDIGHSAFSHSLEMKHIQTHEERTIELFLEYKEIINKIFGYDIVSKVVQIFQDNIAIKEKGHDYEISENLDILFIFRSLLIGTIDCDRMEFIVTDRYMTTGEKLDFRSIFDYITIVLFNNAPTVGFERGAIPIIENLLTNRFEQYEQIYYEEDTVLIELSLQNYLSSFGLKDSPSSLSEYGILHELNCILSNSEKEGTLPYRLAQIIIQGNRDHILFKKFTSEDEFKYFLDKIYSITGDNFDLVMTSHKKNCIYNPDKNRVYIKDDDGVVKDITEVSSKITALRLDYYFVMIDLDPVYHIDATVAQNLQSLFEDNSVEIEKKFLPSSTCMSFGSFNFGYFNIFRLISEIPGVSVNDTIAQKVNHDQYFTPNIPVPSGMAMRHRQSGSQSAYYIKFPTDDGTSITKREELCFSNCSSLEDFLVLAEKAIALKGVTLSDKLTVSHGVKITTTRYKALVTVFDSIVEIAYDISQYEYNGNIEHDFMLECELKQGDDLSLWYLTKFIKNFGFEETNLSKETRAKQALNIK